MSVAGQVKFVDCDIGFSGFWCKNDTLVTISKKESNFAFFKFVYTWVGIHKTS